MDAKIIFICNVSNALAAIANYFFRCNSIYKTFPNVYWGMSLTIGQQRCLNFRPSEFICTGEIRNRVTLVLYTGAHMKGYKTFDLKLEPHDEVGLLS